MNDDVKEILVPVNDTTVPKVNGYYLEGSTCEMIDNNKYNKYIFVKDGKTNDIKCTFDKFNEDPNKMDEKLIQVSFVWDYLNRRTNVDLLKDKLFKTFIQELNSEEYFTICKDLIESSLKLKETPFKLNDTQIEVLKSLCNNTTKDVIVKFRGSGIGTIIQAFCAINLILGKYKNLKILSYGFTNGDNVYKKLLISQNSLDILVNLMNII